jgi:GTPase SAR1 family protein
LNLNYGTWVTNNLQKGGQPRFRDSWEKYCRTADAIIYVVDSSDLGNMEIANVQLHSLLSNNSLNGIPLIVLGNKCDLVESLTVLQVVEKMKLNSIKNRLVACYSISCKNGDNIDSVLKWLTNIKSRK